MSLNAQARRKRRRFRWHRCERWPKPRYKWAEYEDEKGLNDE